MVDKDDVVVTYTVKEILAQIQTTQTQEFAALKSALTSKADKSDIARLEKRLDDHQDRIITLETQEHDEEVASQVHSQRDEKESIWKNKWFRLFGTAIALNVAFWAPYFGAHAHL